MSTTAATDPSSSAAPLLADFASADAELRQLESELPADWAIAQSLLPMMGQLTAADLGHRDLLVQFTQRTMERRVRYARLEPRLTLAPASDDPALRKSIRVLRRKAQIETRLELLDGQIETCEYICETANQRLSDYAHYRKGAGLEWAIVILLAVEVVLLVLDLWANMRAE